MQLDKVTIKNFKGLREAEFDPTNFACLVGENNAGKSSVLQAIVYALNRPTTLPAQHFYSPGDPVEFRLRFRGVSEAHLRRLAPEHRPRIAELVFDGSLTLIVRYRAGERERAEVATERLVPREQRYQADGIKAVLGGKRGRAINAAVTEAYPEFAAGVPEEAWTISAATAYLQNLIAALPRDGFEIAEAPLPSGIGSSISQLLPEPIYIAAVKNLSDDLKTSQTTPFGRLLGLLIEGMAPDLERINESLETLNGLLNRIRVDGREVDNRHAKVRDLERQVEDFLLANFPRVKVELSVPPPELKAILSTAQIFVDDGSRDLIDNKGDGIKRALTFALLQTFVANLPVAPAEEGNEPAPRPLMFLFEEPELYLHPKSQRILFATLGRISQTFQVVVTTHSPLFFAPAVTASFIRIAKAAADPKPIGKLYPVNFNLNDGKAEVFRLARFENADAAFFSQRVVLFEGESDDAYCRHIAALLNPDWDFDRTNISMVRVSGKGNFSKFRNFFEAFGIEVKIVADLDALFDGYEHLGAPDEVATIRNSVLPRIDARISELGVKAELAVRQIRDRINQGSWKTRYEAAKAALRALQAGAPVDDTTLQAIDNLFVWEQNVARVRVCREDQQAATLLHPLIDALRRAGICVLSRGAIEDYYPDVPLAGGSKPQKALEACQHVTDRDQALALSGLFAEGRQPELVELFSEIFR